MLQTFLSFSPRWLAILFLLLAGPARATALEQLIREEFATIKKVREGDLELQDCQLILTTTSQSHASEKNVLINPIQLAVYCQGISLDAQRGFCRFVVAHEIAHVIQYAKYRKAISSFRGEEALFLESQADVIGASIVGHLLLAEYFAKTSAARVAENNAQYVSTFAGDYLDGFFDQIIKLGDEDANLQGRTHPQPEQRALAAKKGLIMGAVQFIESIPSRMTDQGAYLPAAQAAKIDSTVQKYAKSIGYMPGGNYLFWSHEAAQRIVHAPRHYCPDVVMEVLSIDWDAARPPVRYAVRVSNRGEKQLKINFDVSAILCDRKEPNNITLWDFVATDSHDNVDLGKGESQDFYGTLDWEATSGRMPHLVLPTDLGGTYNVFDIEKPSYDSLAVTAFVSQAALVNGRVAPNLLVDFIARLLRERSKYPTYLMGIGEAKTNNAFVYYPSPYRCAATTTPVFKERQGRVALDFSLLGLYQPNEARTWLKELIEAVRESYSSPQVEVDEDGEGFWFSGLAEPNVMRVRLVESPGNLMRVHFAINAARQSGK